MVVNHIFNKHLLEEPILRGVIIDFRVPYTNPGKVRSAGKKVQRLGTIESMKFLGFTNS